MYDNGQDSTERVYSDESVYSGQWSGAPGADSKLHRQGFGQISFGDRSVYRGQLANGLCDENGVAEFPANGRLFPAGSHTYKGQFNKGLFHGFGVFIFSDGSTYEGEFDKGKIQGLGRFTFARQDAQQLTVALPDGYCEGRFDGGRLVSREPCQSVIEQAGEAAAGADLTAATTTDNKTYAGRGDYLQQSNPTYAGKGGQGVYSGQGDKGIYSQQSNTPYSGQGGQGGIYSGQGDDQGVYSPQSNSPYSGQKGQGVYSQQQSESPYSGQGGQSVYSGQGGQGVYSGQGGQGIYSQQSPYSGQRNESVYSGQGGQSVYSNQIGQSVYTSKEGQGTYSGQDDQGVYAPQSNSPYSGQGSRGVYSE